MAFLPLGDSELVSFVAVHRLGTPRGRVPEPEEDRRSRGWLFLHLPHKSLRRVFCLERNQGLLLLLYTGKAGQSSSSAVCQNLGECSYLLVQGEVRDDYLSCSSAVKISERILWTSDRNHLSQREFGVIIFSTVELGIKLNDLKVQLHSCTRILDNSVFLTTVTKSCFSI